MNVNPLTALVQILESARVRLLALIAERAAAEARLHALECEANARAYGRLLDADLGDARNHLACATGLVADLRGHLAARGHASGPAEVEDYLAPAREHARRAAEHLRLHTEEHAEEVVAGWRHRDEAAWDTAMFRHAWAVRACTRCGVRVPDDRPSYVHARTGAETHYCSDACDRAQAARHEALFACHQCGLYGYDRTHDLPDPVFTHRFCSTACRAEHLAAESGGPGADERQELEAAELAAMEDAARDYDPAVDLDDVPF